MADLSAVTITIRVRWWAKPLINGTALVLRVAHLVSPRLGFLAYHRACEWFEAHGGALVKVG